MPTYAALLRGINLGGRTIKMDALRYVLETCGFQNVRTVLASGNVVFDSQSNAPEKLRGEIKAAIKGTFGFDVHVILRSSKEIQALIDSEPFKNANVRPGTRLFITFLSEPPAPRLKAPHRLLLSKTGVLAVTKGHIVSVLAAKDSTPDHMDVLSKKFGAHITTRNWNTIQKIAKLIVAE